MKSTHLAELKRHAAKPVPWAHGDSDWRTAERPRIAYKLWQDGFLDRHQQSEHVRGEPRRYWFEYHITDAGIQELAKHDIHR